MKDRRDMKLADWISKVQDVQNGENMSRRVKDFMYQVIVPR